MASSTAATGVLRVASLPGPPPTPTSLLDLPQPWLLQLAKYSAFEKDSVTLVALLRSCTFFRDAVLRHHTAAAGFVVPIAAEDFPAQVERLCTVARRSSSVRLKIAGHQGLYHSPAEDWTATEPHITQLLVCAVAQLGGERPLACVKEIELGGLEQGSLVPAWVKVLCPSVTKLHLHNDRLAAQPLHQPTALPHLQHLWWGRQWGAQEQLAEHVRQQLAALPSLTSLTLGDLSWASQEWREDEDEEEHERRAGRLISGTVTRLDILEGHVGPWTLHHLLTRFPCLRELDLCSGTLDDDGLEALLLHGLPPTLHRLVVTSFSLQRSHVRAAWPVQEVIVNTLDVDSFARLPLDGIQACTWEVVQPSSDTAAVERVVQAIRRWGGRGCVTRHWGCGVFGERFTALLTTLGPLLSALPAAQQLLTIFGMQGVTADQLQQLGQSLPPGVATLVLLDCDLMPDAWPALLPSLPATVTVLYVLRQTIWAVEEEQVLALCEAAVRPITIKVPRDEFWNGAPSEEALERIRSRVAGVGLVTLKG